MRRKIALIVLGLAVTLLLYRVVRCEVNMFQLRGKVQTISYLRDSSLSSTNLSDIADNLDYLQYLIPKETKGVPGYEVEILVSVYATAASDRMMLRMKELSGVELGGHPDAWIKAYRPVRNPIVPPGNQGVTQ